MYEMEKNAWQKKVIYTYQICIIYVNKTLYGQKYWVTDKRRVQELLTHGN